MIPSSMRRRNSALAAAAGLLLLCGFAGAARSQSFPGVIDPVPAPSGPTVAPLPPPLQPPVINGPAGGGAAKPPAVPGFHQRARDCLHESNAAGLSASRPPGEDRDTFVRRCIDGG